MTTYYEEVLARRREQQRANPFLDLTKQILVPSTSYEEDEDALRVREILLTGWDSTPFWGKNPSAYDTVRFGKNLYLPGHCEVSGKGFEQRLQRDEAPGVHGHSVKQLGIHPAKFSIKVRMWTEEHLEAFALLVPLLKQQRYAAQTSDESNIWATANEVTVNGKVDVSGGFGGAGFLEVSDRIRNRTGKVPSTKTVHVGPKPIDVYHPMLALFKIRACHIAGVSLPEAQSEADVWQAVIECEEFIHRISAVKAADETMEIVERNPRVGKTAATVALEKTRTTPDRKPSATAADPFIGATPGKW